MAFTKSASLRTQYGYILGTTRDLFDEVEVDIESLVNELVGPLPDEGFIVRTSYSLETVDIVLYQIDDVAPATSVIDAWQEAVEVSFLAACDPSPLIDLRTFDHGLEGGPLPGPGHYRVLVCATNRDAVMASRRRGENEPSVRGQYGIYIWPAAPTEPVIHKSIGFQYDR